MTHDDVDQIECRLAIRIPDDYRTCVTNYPDDLSEDARKYDLWDNPKAVIANTEGLRIRFLTSGKWPHTFLVIGSSGCGDYYYLDTEQDRPPVGCWNHETERFAEVASSINDWYQQIRQWDS